MNRDERFDCIKGIAIVFVIVGHVMQFCIPEFSDSIVFRVIWSLQIPLFMVLSGYFGGQKEITFSYKRILRKTLIYLIPFVSYFIINVSLNYDSSLLNNLLKLPFHLEISLWYLFVLYILTMLNEFANILALKIKKNNVIIHSIVFFILVLLYASLYFIGGVTFVGIKYIVYYSLFYSLGWIWRNSNIKILFSVKLNEVIYTIAFFIYVFLIINFDFYNSIDNVVQISLRFLCSITGVFVLIRFVLTNYNKHNFVYKSFTNLGIQSMELYYIHSLFVTRFIKSNALLSSYQGILIVVFMTFILIIISCLIREIIYKSNYLNFLIFGKLDLITLKKKQ